MTRSRPRRPLQALTLWQPWATALAQGPKDVENRGWQPAWMPADGLWLAIHAAKRAMAGEDLAFVRGLWPEARRRSEWPRGAIVGLVHVDRVIDLRRPPEGWSSPWAVGPMCWHVDQRIALEDPLPCRGQQGLWLVPEHLLRQLRVAYAEALRASRAVA